MGEGDVSASQQSVLSQAPIAHFNTQPNTSATEALAFFSDPTKSIQEVRKALLGNCDWIVKRNDTILIEWITREKEDGELEKTWITPPINAPIVDNIQLWNAIEGMMHNYCSIYFLISKPEEPEDLATTIGLDFGLFLWSNWKAFFGNSPSPSAAISRAHYVRNIVVDKIYAIHKSAQNGDIRKLFNSTYAVSLTGNAENNGDKFPGISGMIFGRK
jgi:hypothetical protein